MPAERKEAVRAVMPIDPVTGRWYVNAIGTSETECAANLTFIEMSDEQADRVEYIPVEIRPLEGEQ